MCPTRAWPQAQRAAGTWRRPECVSVQHTSQRSSSSISSPVVSIFGIRTTHRTAARRFPYRRARIGYARSGDTRAQGPTVPASLAGARRRTVFRIPDTAATSSAVATTSSSPPPRGCSACSTNATVPAAGFVCQEVSFAAVTCAARRARGTAPRTADTDEGCNRQRRDRSLRMRSNNPRPRRF